MASTQVLPSTATTSTRKQEHLEAGKRRLEEFRKKRAADKAKKTASTSQPLVVDALPYDKKHLESEHVRHIDSDGAGPSDGVGGAIGGAIDIIMSNDENKPIVSDKNNEQGSFGGIHVSPSMNEAQSLWAPEKDQEIKTYNTSGFAGALDVNYNQQTKGVNDDSGVFNGGGARPPYEITSYESIAFHTPSVQNVDISFSQSAYSGLEEARSRSNSFVNDFSVRYPGISHLVSTNTSPENFGGPPLQNRFDYTAMLANGSTSSSYEGTHHATKLKESALGVVQSMHDDVKLYEHFSPDTGESKLGSFISHLPSALSGTSLLSESLSTSYKFDVGGSPLPNQGPVYSPIAETKTWRSRPSFLDSLNMSRVTPASPFSATEPENDKSFMFDSSRFDSKNALRSSPSQKSITETEVVAPFLNLGPPNMPSAYENSMGSSFTSSNGPDLFRQSVNGSSLERKHSYQLPKPDENFAALEQHIEDLTQEKFSLQRALEASRSLAESLAAENSSLTESYNQQGSIVNQLKSDMERLQEEIKAHLAELKAVQIEYTNAQLECNASDERGKLLASEVIGLEEKALRLRSNELKLERQLENSHAEIASYKKRMSSLEKERQDLHLTIDALQEEKKLLQTKLRKASASGKSIDVSKNESKKDVSTSTEDLDPMPDTSNQEMHNVASFPHDDTSGSTLMEVSSVNIPADQMRMIQNINILISELAMEKDELMKALAAESSQNAKLQDLNKELSRKLETQTQRLELLTSQIMAHGSIPMRQPVTHASHDSSANVDEVVPTYADEGDEVVERVLGWIMKLFPGGPSRRRPSKLL